MRAILLAVLIHLVPVAAWSAEAYPAPECDADHPTRCIARVTPFDRTRHESDARLRVASGVDGTYCVPPRYLELWDPVARRESEKACGLKEHYLDPVGRYFACRISEGQAKCTRPDIGVALEGGGSKTAPFALGVLAGLQRSGVLAKTDIIGSASGGTYAAYFYFARMLERANDPEYPGGGEEQWFRDCLPIAYKSLFPASLGQLGRVAWCQEIGADGSPIALVGGNDFEKAVPFQYQAKVGQDLFWPLQTLRQRGEEWYDADWLSNGALIGGLAVVQVLSMPPHLLAHGLFDWHGNFSPSRELYREGIERAYGHSVTSWTRALESESFPDARPARGYQTGTRRKRSWTLSTLEQAYRDHRQRLPLWILSTSSSPGRPANFWVSPQPRDAQRFSFELGPHGQGSGLTGFLDAPPPDLSLRDAVGVSAAFLDDQQRLVMSSAAAQFVAGAGIFAFNLGWGTNVSNFNVSEAKRSAYAFMPWPLYWLPAFQGVEAPFIRLADGGNVDNLGVVSLLRRGTRSIVVSASTDDVSGTFPSLCRLKNELELEVPRGADRSVYAVYVPALAQFGRVCNRELKRQEIAAWGRDATQRLACTRFGLPFPSAACEQAWDRGTLSSGVSGYNLWRWRQAVIEGCVVRRPAAPREDGESDYDPCGVARSEGREISRLLIIKPAIWLEARDRQLAGDNVRSCTWGNDGATLGEPPDDSIPPGMQLPCIALAHVAHRNLDSTACKHRKHMFPQDEFIKMTINSSYTLYGAYYDLGRHYAAQVALCGDGVSLCPMHMAREEVEACVD